MVALPGPDVAADPFAPLLAALARRRALTPLLMLPARLGMDPDDTATLVGAAVDGGLVEVWTDAPGAPSVILSAEAARRLGLELVSNGLGRVDRYEWSRPSRVKPERAAMLTESDLRHPETGRGGFDAMADPGTVGARMVTIDAAEDPRFAPYLERAGISVVEVDRGPGRGERRMKAAVSLRYNPRLLLGLGCPWPATRTEGGSCPGCGSRPLPDIAYCLACDASGYDDILPPVPKAQRPRPYVRDGEVAGGKGKSKAGRLKVKAKRGKGKRAVAELAAVAG